MVTVKMRELLMADTARHRGNVIDVRFGDHRFHQRLDLADGEFVCAMRLPQRCEIEVRTDRATQGADRALMRQLCRGAVEVIARARECVIGVGVGVQRDVGAATQPCRKRVPDFGGSVFVELGDMQHQRWVVGREFVDMLLEPHAVIAHGHVSARSRD